MVDRLVKTLAALARDRQALQRKEQQLAHRQRQLIKDLSTMLHGIGYTLRPSGNGQGSSGSAGEALRIPGRKVIKCPKCDRRFAHRLPLARHLSASHGMKKTSSAQKGAQARRTKRKTARARS
jgi:uncharacterized C2H2 Zn-finger protein